MAADSSEEESTFTDCASSGVDRGRGGGRRRQCSVPEMLTRAGTRQSKRTAPGRGSRSPPDPTAPAAKRTAVPEPSAAPAGSAARPAPPPATVELSAAALTAIQQLIDAGNARVISAFNERIDVLERRVSILESECFDKDQIIHGLKDRLECQGRVIDDLQQRVEGMDANRRLSSLILACDDFVASSPGENIEERAVQVITKRLPSVHMTVADVHAAHRLQGKNKVIVQFVKRQLRDAVYDGRFELFSRAAGQRQQNMAPLYITESLTPSNRLLYQALLDARRPENGGRIASVFTRRGQVFCRVERGGANIRVPDWEKMQQILDGPDHRSPPGGRPAPPASRGEGSAPPAGRGEGSVPPQPAVRGRDPRSARAGLMGTPISASERQPASISAPEGAAPESPVPAHRMDTAPPEIAPPASDSVATSGRDVSQRDGTGAPPAEAPSVPADGSADAAA